MLTAGTRKPEHMSDEGTEASMSPAAEGNTVKVHYTGKLEDGTVFDSSRGRDPLEVTLGTNTVIAGFEQGLIGMEVGDSKTVTIPPEEAYGPHRGELILEVNGSDFPENITPEVGLQLQMQRPDGQTLPVTIVKIEAGKVTLDANHPLAGKILIFELEMVAVA
jgi:FKBP-type peptidyl-prolyl cis-trans isomerase 2